MASSSPGSENCFLKDICGEGMAVSMLPPAPLPQTLQMSLLSHLRGCGTLSLIALSQSLPSWDVELKKLIRWTLVSSLWKGII